MNKAEREHLSKVAALGCCVCRKLGYGPSPCELHHTREHQGMSSRNGPYGVIGLCPIHHRLGGNGEIGFHQGRKSWEARYGTQQEFLEQTLAEV